MPVAITESQATSGHPGTNIRLGEALPREALHRIGRMLQLHYCKWDTQVGDYSVLSPQPLLMAASEWAWLSLKAQHLTAELYPIEQEIAASPRLQRVVGVPRPLRKLLLRDRAENSLRTLRFDFHPTVNGWVLSEVNSDVPGGFVEASVLPELFRAYYPQAITPSDPLKVWGGMMASELREGQVGLLYAPGFLEDYQVVLALARELASRGFTPHLVQSPKSFKWMDGWAHLRHNRQVRLAAVVRFFQSEWLAELPDRTGWRELFRSGSTTRVVNPVQAVISESKRMALSFPRLRANCTTWREMFPPVLDPREVTGTMQKDWVLKAAYSNTGDAVHLGAEMPAKNWNSLLRTAQRHPEKWVAQRRFETVALPSCRGLVRPCVGVYVIGGRVAGAYIRLSRTQVTDAYALEAPLFLVSEEVLP